MKKINGLAAGGYNNNYDDFHIKVGFCRRIWISSLDHAFPFADANYQLCQSSPCPSRTLEPLCHRVQLHWHRLATRHTSRNH